MLKIPIHVYIVEIKCKGYYISEVNECTCVMYNASILFPKENKCIANNLSIEELIFFSVCEQVKEALVLIIVVPYETWKYVNCVLDLVYFDVTNLFLRL